MTKCKYPRIGERRNVQHGTCIVCGGSTASKVIMQVSNMRGDDDVVRACNNHSTKEIESAYKDRLESKVVQQ